ncbi:MAG: hypothetical protein WAR37_03195 [Candidatus Microsaccharimonas sp.]
MPINYLREGLDTFGLNSAAVGQIITKKGGQWRASHLYTSTSQTAAYTAAVGDHVLADASGGSFVVTLPSASSAGNGASVRVTKADASTGYVRVNAPSAHLNGVPVSYSTLTNVDRTTNITASSLQNIRCDASTSGFTITLPAVSNGAWLRITKTDASVNAIIVLPPTGLIDGQSSAVINSQNQALFFRSDASAWHFMAETYSLVRSPLDTLTFVSDGTTWWTVY